MTLDENWRRMCFKLVLPELFLLSFSMRRRLHGERMGQVCGFMPLCMCICMQMRPVGLFLHGSMPNVGVCLHVYEGVCSQK